MKKNSRQGKRTEGETIGIDLGDKLSRYAVVSAEGEVVEESSFRNRAESIAKHFGRRARARVALETGAQSAWIARELAKCGHEVIVANTRELKWITASDRKSDRGDAVKLALLARADRRLLAPVEYRTAQQQAELSVIRARDGVGADAAGERGARSGEGIWEAAASDGDPQLRKTGWGRTAGDFGAAAGRPAGTD